MNFKKNIYFNFVLILKNDFAFFLRILWYLKNLIKKRTFKNSEIKDQDFFPLIENLVSWLFESRNLKIFLRLNCRIFIQLLLEFFEYDEEFILRNPNMSSFKKLIEKFLEAEQELMEEMNQDEQFAKENRAWIFYFYMRIIKLNKIEISIELKFKLVSEILGNSKLLDALWEENSQNFEFSELEKNLFLLNIIEKLEDLEETKKDSLIETIQKNNIIKNQFQLFLSHLLSVKGHFEDSLVALLESENYLFKKQIFSSIDLIPEEFRSKMAFKRFLIEKMDSLLKTDLQQSHQIIKKELKNFDLDEVLKKVEKLKIIEYLEYLFEVKYEPAFQPKILILHLKIVAETKLNVLLKLLIIIFNI